MSKYDLGLNQFDFASLSGTKIFVLGIGGGNDVVGAYAVATIIKRNHPQSQILYGACTYPKNDNRQGFTGINDGLYIRNSACCDPYMHYSLGNYSLGLVQKLKDFDAELGEPYILTSNKLKEAIQYFSQYTLITIDNGGDSLTGGKDEKNGFDYKNLLCLKEMALHFYHIILGLGCDGESDIKTIQTMLSYQTNSIIGEFSMNEIANIFSPMLYKICSPKRKNTDTTVIIVEVNDFIKNNSVGEQLYLVPRHERDTKVPYAWINRAVVFEGEKLVL